jgi:hypothetical protein
MLIKRCTLCGADAVHEIALGKSEPDSRTWEPVVRIPLCQEHNDALSNTVQEELLPQEFSTLRVVPDGISTD